MDFSKYKKALVQSLRMNRPTPVPPDDIPVINWEPMVDLRPAIRDYQRQLINDLFYMSPELIAIQSEDRIHRPGQNAPVTYIGLDPARPDTPDVTVIGPDPMNLENNRSHWFAYTDMGRVETGKLLDLEPEAEEPFEPHYQNRLEACE